MKRFKWKQSPFTPLLILVMIICGYMIGAKGEKADTMKQSLKRNLLADEALNVIHSDHPINLEVLHNITEQQEENSSGDDGTTSESQDNKENTMTCAERARMTGVHIIDEITDSYAKQLVEDYCNRTVIACSSLKLQRYNEEWLYRQTFDTMTGYKGLVKMSASKETSISFEVTSEMTGVTVVIVFPDLSYVAVELNEKINLDLPMGDSMLLYIGENLSGSIEVKIEENDAITCKRM